MLTFSILISIFIALFYMFNKYNKHTKDIVSLICLFSFCITWSIFMLIDEKRIPIYFEAIILFILLSSFYYLLTHKNIKNHSLIYAHQENYWDIDKDYIIKIFAERSIEKEDRIEVLAAKESLYLDDNQSDEKYISTNTISYFKKIHSIYQNNIINKIDEIKNYPLHNKIYNKIVEYLEKDKELFLDYNSILEKFDQNLDLFIIYLWDNYSKDFNIGIGQLESITTNNLIEQELINTLDNTNLKMIKLKGSYLQYKYEKFKKEKGI
jgi:hypothetical protein